MKEIPGPGEASGSPSIPLTPNLDQAAASRLAAASAATKARAATFDSGPVGEALRKAGNSADYRAPDSSLPGKFFAASPGGAERVGAFRAAAPTIDPLHDAAAESLRREAMAPDGTIDPKKFAAWQAKHQDALRALRNPPAWAASTGVGAGDSARRGARGIVPINANGHYRCRRNFLAERCSRTSVIGDLGPRIRSGRLRRSARLRALRWLRWRAGMR
jgi:hypothetical protein